jgi:alginate O-acetyltransferase complex protein AlgI
MLFNSLAFAVFFPLVYLVYRVLPHRAQNLFLLGASYLFYGSWDWRFLSLLAISTCVDYGCGIAMAAATEQRRRKALLGASLVSNLGMLAVFKYFDFFVGSMQDLLGGLGLDFDQTTLGIVLPVGISFYTFQTLSYTIDVYRGDLAPERDFVTFALFVSFFPQLVAGPIERATRLLPQLRAPRRITPDQVTQGAWLVFWGFFLKTFVADNLGPIASEVFDGTGSVDGARALIGVYAFAFQIFGDFAGYSSIAIGIALMMGIRLSTNFRSPYLVTNPRDFWHHWHISLSTWLRDYLYIPLGGGRGTRWFVYRNLFLTMLLGGLWHGAAWTFVLWGAFQGALLVGHRAWLERFPTPLADGTSMAGRGWWALKVLAMFHATCLGWLIFRSPSLERLGQILAGMVSSLRYPTAADAFHLLQLAFFTGLLLAIQLMQRRAGDVAAAGSTPAWSRVPVAAAMLFLMLVWGNYGGSAFIYFQF